MKLHALPFLTVGLLVGTLGVQAQQPAPPPGGGVTPPVQTNTTDYSKIFKSEKEKFSYALGMNWGAGLKNGLKRDDVELDMEVFKKAFMDSLTNGPTLLTEQQDGEIVKEFSAKMRAEKEAKRAALMEKNKAEGEAFLAKNKNEPGIVTLTNGLQYKILTEGKGEPPKPEDEVTVNYRGTFIDGTEFDSSYKRNQPYTTHVRGGVIVGWTEALQLMKPGAKWKLFIPPSLAYGQRGMGSAIPPESTLIFEIELLSIKPAPAHASATPPSAPPLTSDIIKVPSAEEMKKGAKIETIKAEDIDKEKAKANQ